MPKKILSIPITLAIFISSATCGTPQVNNNPHREERILNLYSQEKKDKYAELLVNIDRYTSNGAHYQRLYYKYLIGVATDLSEFKKLKIINGSLGFYYDNKKEKTKLYLGLEIDTEQKLSGKYSKIAISFIHNDLRKVIETIYSCKSLFKEDNIIGIVIGWKWQNNGINEQINIWITEQDVLKFENRELTFEELIRRNTLTNTEGIIIMLPL